MGTYDMGADEYSGQHLLEADPLSLYYAAGGTVDFILNGGLENGGRYYLLLVTFAGTTPGTPLPGGVKTLPLNWDLLTNQGIALVNSPVFQNFLGKLGPATGQALATFDTCGPMHGAFEFTLSFAYVLESPFDFVSNPINVEIYK
jgi:hypothetical protein